MKRRVYCAETSDISSIETPMGNLMLNEERKESLKNEQDELNIESVLQENSNKPEELKPPVDIDLSPSTNESESITKEFNILKSLNFSFSMRLDYLLKKAIPVLNENHDEILNIFKKIKENITKIENKAQAKNVSLIGKIFQFFKNPATQDPYFLENIELFYKEKLIFYVGVYLTINNMKDKAEKINNNFLYFCFKLQKMEASGDYHDLKNISKEFVDSKIDKAAEFFLNEVKCFEVPFEEDKKQANLVLSILTKFNTLTPEEFEADEEVKQFLST